MPGAQVSMSDGTLGTVAPSSRIRSLWGIGGAGRVCFLALMKDANVQEVSSSRPQVARLNDAAHELRVSQSTVRRLIAAGRLKSVSLGKRAVGVTYAEISRFLADAAR